MLDPNYKTRPTVDQILAIPCVRDVMKKRLKSYMMSGSVKKLSRALRGSPNAPSTPVLTKKSQTKDVDADDTFSEEDEHMDVPNLRSNTSSDLLNSSDEFIMPSNPPPRRAFTTPAMRRRPATSSFSGSPIKRLLFHDDNLPKTPSSVNNTPDGSDPDGHGSSPISTRSLSSTRATRASSVTSLGSDRPGTPPTGQPLNMECDDRDEPKLSIEPKNLLGMFEAASDEEL
ncbi:membrane-associated tyrosine- and threonine-specific cdc2-inhibitory kinase-like [Plakobranchus ocellatus]|uniref:Membrane-associated tyrosine- and threonine-specific cdc2-inhibitory kinase-like n=1 Tax=Plakobranchus ocellatus TaxID=259542 RepID=A0AAV4CE69_9GAST|nr:membrane-associated tyrosine- and threonine-specific cdc2-inhibitory kinase-like [Plakobranchus ocellatus]